MSMGWLHGVMKVAAATTLALSASAARAESEPNTWLIRTTVAEPTTATLSANLSLPVLSVSHVAGQLYKITVSPQSEGRLENKSLGLSAVQTLRQRIARDKAGVITHIQRNFIYRTALVKPRQAALSVRPEEEVMLRVADNPAVREYDQNPGAGADPKLSAQWAINKIGAQQAWNTQRGSKSILVAVIDTGVDYNHEDLRNNIWRNRNEIAGNGIDDDNNGFIDDVVGWDFVSNDNLPFDLTTDMRIDGNPGHGTHCAGVVGAAGNNGKGVSGVAPNISILPIRFLSEKGEGSTEGAVKALNYAVAMGARVVSNSWGGEKDEEDDTALQQAIIDAEAKGVLMVFAAGNGGADGVGDDNDGSKPAIPASYPFENIISVAASDSADKLGPFSNYGKISVDLAAPGVKIMSSVPGNQYEDMISVFGYPFGEWSGTSMAAPAVSGAAAIVWSQYPNETYAQIKQRLLSTVTPIAGLNGKVKTGGVLNVARALQ